MGIFTANNCIFFGVPVENYVGAEMRHAIEYFVDFKTCKKFLRLPVNAANWVNEDEFFKKNLNIFQGLLLNNDWFDDSETLITIDKLKELLLQKTFPKSPQDKVDALFEYFLAMQVEDGRTVTVDAEYLEYWAWKRLYFKSLGELNYYAKFLHDTGLINGYFSRFDEESDRIEEFVITIKGLNYGIKLQTEGEKSNFCFVAMAFNGETFYTRNAIKEALSETGFQPILIDEQNINSDRTINDEIIASLKKCRFCIADFSYHSKGVYFESGFALGQGKKVIYTCLDTQFNDAHFDIKPLQHIIYKTAEQLKKDLIHKIDAWIK